MKRIILAVSCMTALAFCLGACSQTSSANANPAMTHHSDDNKGQDVFPKYRQATGRKVFIFDPKHTAWAAYNAQGARVKTGRASGGKSWCDDIGRSCRTTVGKYTVYLKKGADCESSKYPVGEGGAPMPHCMYFYRGYAIHGSSSVPNYNASHGCIRVTPSAAEWLNQNFITRGTQVIVEPYHRGHS